MSNRIQRTRSIGVISAWALFALSLTSCGGGTNEATKSFSVDFGLSMRSTTQCIDSNTAYSCTVRDLYGDPDKYCLAIKLKSNSVWADDPSTASRYEDVSWGKFEDVCERWEIVREMPVFQARSEVAELVQRIDKVND